MSNYLSPEALSQVYAGLRANDEHAREHGSAAAQAAAAERQAYRERQAEVGADNQRRLDERERARQAEVEQEVRERREAEQKEAEAQLRAQLRAAFLAEPAATEQDFTAAYPRLRQEHLEREAQRKGSAFDREMVMARERHPFF